MKCEPAAPRTPTSATIETRRARPIIVPVADSNTARKSREPRRQANRSTRRAIGADVGTVRPVASEPGGVFTSLPRFLAQHPALYVDIVFDDRNINLVEAGIDIGLRVGQLGNSTLIARKIAQCERRVIGTNSPVQCAWTIQT